MLRLMGAVLLVGGCGAVGFSAAGRLARRVEVLRALLGALEGMERELSFRLTPMPELLERALRLYQGRAFWDGSSNTDNSSSGIYNYTYITLLFYLICNFL